MISFLEGEIVEKSGARIVVDVAGVGYDVMVPTSTLASLPPVGRRARVHTRMIVRDEAMLLYGFGAFLLYTAVKMAFSKEEDEVDPEASLVLRLGRRLLPVARSDTEGYRFFTREGGRLHATPLLVALVGLEATDIVFAIDSVPAIFAVTREPFIVFTSNIFAILGLRSLYFLLGGAVEKFHLLRYGLAFVLVFVGLKMVWLDEWYGGKFPIGLSLAIIASAITASIVASLMIPPRHPAPDARVAHPDER